MITSLQKPARSDLLCHVLSLKFPLLEIATSDSNFQKWHLHIPPFNILQLQPNAMPSRTKYVSCCQATHYLQILLINLQTKFLECIYYNIFGYFILLHYSFTVALWILNIWNYFSNVPRNPNHSIRLAILLTEVPLLRWTDSSMTSSTISIDGRNTSSQHVLFIIKTFNLN